MKQLFIIDPINNIDPSKDSSAALMQAANRSLIEVWYCTLSDLQALGGDINVIATKINTEPWFKKIKSKNLPLSEFNCIWMRKDPPVNEVYIYATHLLEIAQSNGVLIINKPAALRSWNEKLSSLKFSHLMSPTLVSCRTQEIINFINEYCQVVIKPLGGRGGQGIIRINKDYEGIQALCELITFQQKKPIMVQKFLGKVSNGDKRIILINGTPFGAINRLPKRGEFRSNLALGGKAEQTELSRKDHEICEELKPHLIKEGLFFVGIDVIDGKLSEINVTSPTGLKEIETLANKPIADQIIKELLENYS